jgi:hypothetical protein
MQVPLIRLQCGANSYDWGKVGKESAAAKFAAATASDFSIQEDKPYAEVCLDTLGLYICISYTEEGVSSGWAHILRIPLKMSTQNEHC